MQVGALEPVVGRLRERRSLLHADVERLPPGRPSPEPVDRLLDSLEEELDCLLSLAGDWQEAVGRALGLQHERLRQHAEALDSLLDLMLHFGTPDPWQRAAARVLLSDFSRELCDHLSFEEQNGCLERAAEAEPRFVRRVVALRDEHDDFRSWAARLADLAQQAGLPDGDWEGVRRDFHQLCHALRRHEQAEAELVYATYQLDLGGSG